MIIAQKPTECCYCGKEIPKGAWFESTDDDGDFCSDCYDNIQITESIMWDNWKETKH